MKDTILCDPRLLSAASFARSGAIVADVGTDHAYLPVYLVSNGIASRAVASDINKGPLVSAQKNIALKGLSHKIDTCLADGLDGIDEYSPEDIYILGMGGELIYRIVSGSELPKRHGVRLILQPMTHPQDLRCGLWRDGFDIIDECMVRDGERIYQIIVAEYDGVSREGSKIECLLGKKNLQTRCSELGLLAEIHARGLKKRIDGLSASGTRDEDAEVLYEELMKIARGDYNDN